MPDGDSTCSLITLDEAITAALSSAKSIHTTERIRFLDAYGRVLATDGFTRLEVPPYDNSAMDGAAALLSLIDPDQDFETAILQCRCTELIMMTVQDLIEGKRLAMDQETDALPGLEAIKGGQHSFHGFRRLQATCVYQDVASGHDFLT
jgi:hypothetical protein